MRKFKRLICLAAAGALFAASSMTMSGCSESQSNVTLRVCSWEEYIDLGGWDEDELIDIFDEELCPDGILGKNSMVDDFTEWFNSTHDFNVNVEYSTFGTNEDLYNRLSLGDAYDLVCPSDYMIMKLVAEDKVLPFSDTFFDTSDEHNYYYNNVSDYIYDIFSDYGWDKYAACYMWGTTGIVYNPEEIADVSDVATWSILKNQEYKRQVTIKDNVRDAYFVTLGMMNADTLTNISDSENSREERSNILNNTDSDTISSAQEVLKEIKDNVYSFETDSGKADMVTGKVIANYQWSGDAVYIMDEADDDESSVELWYSVPDECTNLWFDGWVMLKDGINNDAQKQIAAEAFVNYLSRPDNAIRNMYCIGYTSSIAGDLVYDYMDWNYGFVFDPEDEYFDEELNEIYEYDLSYFFGEGYAPLYVDAQTLELDFDQLDFEITALGDEYGNDIAYKVYSDEKINRGRQLFAQYPPQNVIDRSVIMLDFGDKLADINQMWINVRCLDMMDISPVTIGIIIGIVAAVAVAILLYAFRYKIFIGHKPVKGYKKI